MADSPVFHASGDDPELLAASERARATFKYFWRELAWEQRRIIPALDMAAVKAAFSDDQEDPEAYVEHMWVNDVMFDGHQVIGTLVNQPNQLTTITQGDDVGLESEDIEDWMYAREGKVYGAFTVNVLRARMTAAERKAHDDAWGLEFGDPTRPALVPWDDPDAEHPMSDNMAPKLAEELAKNLKALLAPDDVGMTLLHQLALAGSEACVRAVLAAGADRNARSEAGATALDLAKVLGWPRVIALLQDPT